jgi:hypothetical protein
MFTFVLSIALVLTAFAQDLPSSFSLCDMESPIAMINTISIDPFPLQAGQNTTVFLDLSLSSQLTPDAHLDILSIYEAQVTDSFPIDCTESCGPGNITHEMSIPVPEDVETGSINVTVRAFNGVGEVDGIFCIQGTLEFVGV